MATNRFTGNAQPVTQVDTVTVGGVAAAGQTYTVTCNGKTVNYLSVLADTNATIATALAAALTACTFGEFTEMTWEVDATVTTQINVTASVSGVPFTITSTADGTGTLVHAAVTAATGPAFWSNAANWTLAAVPVNTDDVVISGTSQSIKYGIAQSAVTLNSLTLDGTYSGAVGLPTFNTGGYYEYRTKTLAISATTVFIGSPSSGGPSLCRLHLGTNASAVTVYSTGPRTDSTLPALMLQGTHASNVLNLLSGDVGVAFDPGETASFPVVDIGYLNQPATDVQLVFGAGATITALTMGGGTVEARTNVTTLVQNDGIFTLRGSATLGTLTQRGGTTYYQTSGTLTAATIGGTIDFRRDVRARTVTNLTLAHGGSLFDSSKTVTFTNPFALSNCGLGDVTIDLGKGFSVQRS